MPTDTCFGQGQASLLEGLAACGFQPRVVLDIGAARAEWSCATAEIFPHARFELFEPLAQRNPDYRRHLRLALASHERFRLHEFALGEHDATAPFWVDPGGVGSSLLLPDSPPEQRADIRVRRLDDLLDSRSIEQPQFIKADVQGAELSIIRGGRRVFADADILILEAWLRRAYRQSTPLLHDLTDELTPLGFRLVQFAGFWRRDDHELCTVDAVYAHRRLIDSLGRDSDADNWPWPSNWEPQA